MAPRIIRMCFSFFRWTPVVFISAIVVWSYYAYIIQMCIYTVENKLEKVLYILLYHPLIVMFAWSYVKTIFTPVGTVPKKFYLRRQEADILSIEKDLEVQKKILIDFATNNNLPIQNRTVNGAPRYCEKCGCIKPDRCHHCSVCGTCVLKMDHHCPWVNNCVGFTTYKFFVMFLGYALVYCIYVALTSLKYFILFWSGGVGLHFGRFHVLFLFFVAIMFAISLISLFGYHCYLTAKNRSTLESFRSPIFQSGPDKNGFSLGRYNNFMEIFGDNKKLWFIPVFTSMGNGITFPTRTIDLDSDGLLADRQRWMEEGELDSHFENGHLCRDEDL